MAKHELVWNVYCEDYNKKDIVVYNVFRHRTFLEQCKKMYRKYRKPEQAAELENKIMGWAQYCFWSKCEYEIVLEGWVHSTVEKKIDIYQQLMLNWDYFFKYITDHRADFLRKERKKTDGKQNEQAQPS